MWKLLVSSHSNLFIYIINSGQVTISQDDDDEDEDELNDSGENNMVIQLHGEQMQQ